MLNTVIEAKFGDDPLLSMNANTLMIKLNWLNYVNALKYITGVFKTLWNICDRTFLQRQPRKIVKHTQTIHRKIDDELLECVWPFSGVGANKIKNYEKCVLFYQKGPFRFRGIQFFVIFFFSFPQFPDWKGQMKLE